MRIDIITLHPELLESPFSVSILKRAIDKKLVDVVVHQLRDYSDDKHRRVDDTQFGGGAGMVMSVQPISSLLDQLMSERNYDEVIYMSPDGSRFDQGEANQLSTCSSLILLCGHYKGIDQRIRDVYITKEISIGDFVLSGGELPAAMVCDAVIRLLPGVLGDETSALTDSFQDGLLAPPVYTRPAEWRGYKVPDVLLSGHAKNIEDWRHEEAVKRTQLMRPDLLE
ncbi:MAG: tRNA (guanosine(37)-N1)-methyltransferase TrmD [Flavobacteriales bacterium]|nr:tRNA (guanosine(37)-N1)-methyltransferase TrmD [Flavobacteriales bacterium]